MQLLVPTVTIGLFVFNGEATLRKSLDSLLAQSFADFELVISDNASTDGTESICREYGERDHRIRYLRQRENMGGGANLKVVLGAARGEYFMWAACDDTRSADFIEVNLKFLLANPDYVASTSPNGFEGRDMNKENLVSFALDGDVYARFIRFFENCWMSHGIFYSLIRTNALRDCPIIGQSFLAIDWAIDLYIASRGKIHRTDDGYTVFGVKGVSSSGGAYRSSRNSLIELPFPFYRLTLYVIGLTRSFPVSQRLKIIHTLVRLNLKATFDQFLAFLYRYYCAVFKSGTRQDKAGDPYAGIK